ncbi:MAG: glycosyltransferase family 4 protein [Phycisphaerae bacterium]|jgi:glycosyltransferase involved in cell wall biosynthesis|nr:glycosyltransferase family 4 protein [Phycisphaerae bacterium]HOO17596.1 glycosyltransferase family 4 protein [Phycisphaerae bacterium]HPC22426.1 glycosyltransferase family 4 protein [Phycisphaerae bacterium]HRS29208.1 glycosyltransferase family 4 protein [Phycisphaerae bacterium]HRT41704.1 glycosyltransferase family 4 protein [Phycisphaerae bacterium]
MHICHVITRLIVGGAQENTLLTCEGLHQRGHRVTLIAGPTTGPEGSLVPRARSGGYEYIEIPDLIRAINPWLDCRARRLLAMEFNRLRPDIVHTHSSKAGILARFAARDARVPVVVHTIHGMSFNRTQPALVRRAYAWAELLAARRSHAIVTVANAMIEQSVAARICRRDKMLTIYSGMEVERFTPRPELRQAARAAWGVSDEQVVVGTIARLFRRKGYEQLLPIMADAAGREPRLHFVWVGDGAQRREYEAELERLGLRKRTTLVGLVPPQRVPELIAGFDVLAHTSQWEGLPRAVVQALLMQVPAVAFDIDGTPEVVLDNQTGRLIPLNNFAEFATALVELAADANLRQRLGAAGRAHCLPLFDWRTMVDQLEQLYLRLARR